MIAATVTHHATSAGFWPTSLGGWAAVFAAVAASIGSMIAYVNHGKIQDVHVLVNGRFAQAVGDIVELRRRSGLPERPEQPNRQSAIDGMTVAEVIAAANKIIRDAEQGKRQ